MKLEFVLELKQLSLSEVFVIKRTNQMISEFKQKLKVLMRTEVQNRKAKYCAFSCRERLRKLKTKTKTKQE